jgi:integrase
VLDRQQAADLLGSFGTWRDRAIAGLMLYCGLRSAETLALNVTDVEIGGRWVLVIGKGDRQRRVPLDPDVASVIQVYLLAERPETASTRMFIVAKGPHRGQPLTPAAAGEEGVGEDAVQPGLQVRAGLELPEGGVCPGERFSAPDLRRQRGCVSCAALRDTAVPGMAARRAQTAWPAALAFP